MHTEGKNTDGKTTTKLEGTVATTAAATIKIKVTGEAEVEDKKKKLAICKVMLQKSG